MDMNQDYQNCTHGAGTREGAGTYLEFLEHLLHGLAQHVHQHVQAPAVGHAKDKVRDAQLAGPVNHHLEAWDDGLAAVQAEALGGVVLVAQEALEVVGVGQALKDVQLLLLAVRQPHGGLHPGTDPIALVARGHVHVLHAHGLAVRLPQGLNHLAQRDGAALGQVAQKALVPTFGRAQQVQLAVQVLVREAVVLVVQLGRRGGRPKGMEPQGVEVGHLVATELVRTDQVAQAQRVRRFHAGGHGRRRGDSSLEPRGRHEGALCVMVCVCVCVCLRGRGGGHRNHHNPPPVMQCALRTSVRPDSMALKYTSQDLWTLSLFLSHARYISSTYTELLPDMKDSCGLVDRARSNCRCDAPAADARPYWPPPTDNSTRAGRRWAVRAWGWGWGGEQGERECDGAYRDRDLEPVSLSLSHTYQTCAAD